MLTGLAATRYDNYRTASYKHAKEKADSVMARTFEYQKANNLYIGNVKCTTYSKFHIFTDIHNLSFRVLPNSHHINKGLNHYFGESATKIEYAGHGILNREVIAFYSTMNNIKKIRSVIADNISIMLYSPYLINDKLLSPFNKLNKSYYRYKADSTIITRGREKVYISVKPRYKNNQLVNANAIIDRLTGKVDFVNIKAVYDHILRINISFTMGSDGIRSILPESAMAHVYYKFFGNKIGAQILTLIDYKAIGTKEHLDSLMKTTNKYNLTELGLLENDTNDTFDEKYFAAHRPRPLTLQEDSIYTSYEETKYREKAVTNTKVPVKSNNFEDVFLDRHKVYFFNKKAVLSIPALLSPSMLQWSGKRGISIQKRLTLNMQMNNGMSIKMTPRLGYSFKQKQIYWSVPVNFLILPKINGGFKLTAGNGNHIYSSLQAKEVREEIKKVNNYDSILNVFNRYNFNYYNDFSIRGEFYVKPLAGMTVKFGGVYHKRGLVNWNSEASKNGMKRYYKSFAPRLEMSYTPHTYYYKTKSQTMPLYSEWPTVRLIYERGVNFLGCNNQYEQIEADCAYRINITDTRSLFLRGGCGFFTNRKDMYFVDYDNFSFHNMPSGWNDDMSDEFQLLDRRFYNESNYYAMLCGTYDVPILITGRIPFISKSINRERIYLNVVSMHALNPYGEFGYGVSTTFFDGAVFVGAGRHTEPRFGAKISLRFFDNW